MPPPTTTILSSSFDKGARFRVEDDDGGGGDDIINLLYRPKPKTTTAGRYCSSSKMPRSTQVDRSKTTRVQQHSGVYIKAAIRIT
tara:strand:+ start:4023 stop:4277 length:255 start_codon:yes stop_codon:yes gene_type:complete